MIYFFLRNGPLTVLNETSGYFLRSKPAENSEGEYRLIITTFLKYQLNSLIKRWNIFRRRSNRFNIFF
jgi:hypothetical protein